MNNTMTMVITEYSLKDGKLVASNRTETSEYNTTQFNNTKMEVQNESTSREMGDCAA